jgi:hypothetical protein
MPTFQGPYCPEWCVEVHSVKEVQDQFTMHWKGFGANPEGHESLVKVWVAFEGESKYSSGAEVSALETYWADDIRSLAQDCLEAAQWMEDHLQNIEEPVEKN